MPAAGGAVQIAVTGYTCSCKNTGVTVGQSGNRMAVAAETECTWKYPFTGSAGVSYSKNGIGANFSIAWNPQGAASDDFDGGELVNTCGWF